MESLIKHLLLLFGHIKSCNISAIQNVLTTEVEGRDENDGIRNTWHQTGHGNAQLREISALMVRFVFYCHPLAMKTVLK